MVLLFGNSYSRILSPAPNLLGPTFLILPALPLLLELTLA